MIVLLLNGLFAALETVAARQGGAGVGYHRTPLEEGLRRTVGWLRETGRV